MSLLALLATNALIVGLYMTVWFSVSYLRKRLDVVDTAWGGGFIIVALASFLQSPHALSGILLLMVSVWGLRLAYHIGWRNYGKKNDPRYDELSAKWKPETFWWRAYISVFLLQGLLVLLISLPVTLAAYETADVLTFTLVMGVVLWAAGLLTEVIADYQLQRFLRTRTDTNSVMQKGLWRYSRHPNYFGEIIVWLGIALVASNAPQGWLGWIGPLVLTYLIVFVSGIPPQEKRKKTDAAYQAYARHTSVLVPLPRKG